MVLGRLAAGAFLVCFVTGVYSHYLQDPLQWMRLPTIPVLYQVTQGTHVASGLVSVPLLLAKLWTVYPQLFRWPPVTSLLMFGERLLIGVLVSASLLELTIGVMNIFHWYAWPFSFRAVHFALAWVIVGALLVHVACKLPVILNNWNSPARRGGEAAGDSASGDRRWFLASVGGAAAAVVLFTAGQSTKLFSGINLFGPRHYGAGPQGVPVNRTAEAAAVFSSAVDPDWSLTITGGGRTRSFDYAALMAMPQTTVELPIACVEGWSTTAEWTGVRLRDLLATIDMPIQARLKITSLQTRGAYGTSEMGPEYATDARTLLALELNGEVLDLDHGYPARIIAPGRPGVLQTKWVSTIERID